MLARGGLRRKRPSHTSSPPATRSPALACSDLTHKTLAENSTRLELETSLKELSILYNISQAMTASIDSQELCERLGEVIVRNIGVQDFAILLLNEANQTLDVKAALGFKQNHSVRQLTFKLGEGICGRAAQQRQAVYIPDTSKDPLYLYYKGEKNEDGSFLCLPIVSKNTLLGAINFSRTGTDAFPARERRLLTTLAAQMAMALENARLYAKTKELSLLDELTRIYNRRHLQNVLEMEYKRAQRFKRPLSLLMIDVDHFKEFNDRFGHLEGDALLADLAQVLATHLREVDTPARYGGEEFAVVLPNTSLKDAEKVGTKLQQLIGRMHEQRPEMPERRITVSVGIASLQHDRDSLEDLVNHADLALYRAKNHGRNQVRVYRTSEIDSDAVLIPLVPNTKPSLLSTV